LNFKTCEMKSLTTRFRCFHVCR